MADPETCSFLEKHGLARLIERFADEGIGLADFSFLRQNYTDLHGLLPTLRDRIDFIKATTENNTKSTQVDMEPRIVPREGLLSICSKYDYGRKFMQSYTIKDGKREYTPESRKYLKKAVVEHFFVLTRGRITHQHFTEMVQIILEELPDEDARTWYVPVFKNKSAGGFLYNTYRYMQSTDKRFKKTPEQQDEPGPSHSFKHQLWDNMNADQKAKCQAAKHQLKVTGYSDSGMITMCWKQCFPLRRHEAMIGKIVFNDWEVLGHFDDVHNLVSHVNHYSGCLSLFLTLWALDQL